MKKEKRLLKRAVQKEHTFTGAGEAETKISGNKEKKENIFKEITREGVT